MLTTPLVCYGKEKNWKRKIGGLTLIYDNLRPNIEARQKVADDFAEKLRPLFDGMKARGLSQRGMVTELNAIGVPAPKGGAWRLSQVQRVIRR